MSSEEPSALTKNVELLNSATGSKLTCIQRATLIRLGDEIDTTEPLSAEVPLLIYNS